MNTTTEINQHCVDTCNALLRGERSAVETYSKAIEKFSSEPQANTLRAIASEHAASVDRLHANVLGMGGKPDTDSGAWGSFANTVQSAANLLGENSAIRSLIEGEQHGRKQYLDAVADPAVMPECKHMISTELLPKIEKHLDTLNRINAAL